MLVVRILFKEWSIGQHCHYILETHWKCRISVPIQTNRIGTCIFPPRYPGYTFSSVYLLSHVRLFETPWTAARQVSPSITNSPSLLKTMSIESVMPSNHLILCCPLSSCLPSFPAWGLFKRVSSSHQVAKVLKFQLQHQSFQWIFRTDFL